MDTWMQGKTSSSDSDTSERAGQSNGTAAGRHAQETAEEQVNHQSEKSDQELVGAQDQHGGVHINSQTTVTERTTHAAEGQPEASRTPGRWNREVKSFSNEGGSLPPFGKAKLGNAGIFRKNCASGKRETFFIKET